MGVFSQSVLSVLFVPTGVPYLSYYLTRVLHPQATLGETRGAAVFNELRARLRWGWLLGPSALGALARQLLEFDKKGTDASTRGASLAARAVLDSLVGESEHARELFAVIQDMSWRHAPRSVRVYAQAWLLADAASRGAFHEVVRLSWRGPRTMRRVFMRGAARCVLGQIHAPARWKLVGLWLLASGRIRAFNLLKLALRSPIRALLPEPAHDFASAKRATFALLRQPRGQATRSDLVGVAGAWESVFDSGQMLELLSERREALQGTFSIEAVASRFEHEVIAQLTALLPATLAAASPRSRCPSRC